MLKFILVQKYKSETIEFHYEYDIENKEEAILNKSYECGGNIVEAFSFNECLRILNEKEKYLNFLKKSKSNKTILKGHYAESLLSEISYITLFDLESDFIEKALVTYTVYNDKRNFKMTLEKFLHCFDFDRAYKTFIGSDDDPGYLKKVNQNTHVDDFKERKDKAFEMTRKKFLENFMHHWNKYSEQWLNYDNYNPIINIIKIGL